MAHQAACHTLSNAFYEIYEDMVQILLMLKVLFTQDSEEEDPICGASPGSKSEMTVGIEKMLYESQMIIFFVENGQKYF